MSVQVVNMIPRSLSDEVEQDSEPSITVNPANPQEIVGTAFTPDPFGGPQTCDGRGIERFGEQPFELTRLRLDLRGEMGASVLGHQNDPPAAGVRGA